MKQNNETVVETKKQENFATEIFHEFKVHSRITIICMTILLAIGTFFYYKNDVDWRELFSSYDYVLQDGEGQNYYNSNVGGDVNNGAENKETEK